MAVVLATAAFWGCSRDEQQGVVASVNDHFLSRKELDARAENIVALFRHRMGSRVNTNQLEKIRAQFLAGYEKVWIEDRVLADYAAREGLILSNGLIKTCQDGAFKNFRRPTDKGYADLLEIKGLRKDLWIDQVRSEALRRAVRNHWGSLCPTNIPDSYVEDVVSSIRAHNARMAMTNALQYAKATNVWEKLKAGAEFVQTARLNTELSEEIVDNCEWAVIDRKFLSDEPLLLKWLDSAKPGDFSPPIPADNGVLIVRLDRFEQDDGFAVSRIFFHLGQMYEPAAKEEIVAVAEKKHIEQVFSSRLKALVDDAHIVRSVNLTKTKEKKE